MRRLGTIAAVLVALLFAGWWWRTTERTIGALQVEARSADSARKVAEATARRIDTLYTRDTIRLTRWLTRYDTARVTLNVHDTVEVLRFVAVADSTIRACTTALSTCEFRIAAERDVSAAWERRFRLERAQRPSFLGTWVPRVAAFGLGIVAGKVAP